MKNISSFCLFLILFFSASCANKITDNTSSIKHPRWLADVDNGENFHAIGVTNKNASLEEATNRAKNNAIDNLRINIFIKLRDLFLTEIEKTNYKDKKKILSVLNNKIRSNITIDFLKDISHIEEVWRSPDTGVLYVKVVVEKDKIINKIVTSLEEIKLNCDNDEIKNLIKNIDSNIINNNNFKIFNKSKAIKFNSFDENWSSRKDKIDEKINKIIKDSK